MKGRVAKAFAPATITNFFATSYRKGETSDLSHAGATGGGYILSRGAVTMATLFDEAGPMEVVVDGDAGYNALTTRTAVKLLLEEAGETRKKVRLEQWVQVPIGHGFGASAASALSAVYATAGALKLDIPRERVAYFAHVAEILNQTGLGTVSAAYDGVGAGVVFEPGAPGIGRFMNVSVPSGVKIVAASLAPCRNRELLSSGDSVAKVNRLGSEALARVLKEPTLDCLATAGEWFSEELGMTRSDVRELVDVAKSAGAFHASQNMIGHAMHAVVNGESAERVARALASSALRPRVDVLEIGAQRAGVTSVFEADYPTSTSSLV